MDKLLSINRVKDIIRSSANLDYLSPMLLKCELLTPLEFEYLCDRNIDEFKRIDYLIDKVLIRKGDHVDNFTLSLKKEDQHSGHKDILLVVEQEMKKLPKLTKREVECYEADASVSKRPRMHRSNGINGVIKAVKDFTGRELIVQELLEQLKDNSIQLYCVCGMPGVGKSQLAIVVGLEMEQKFGYTLTYHDYIGKKEFDDSLFVNTSGWDKHCLVLDNIDGLLCNSQHWPVLMDTLHQTLHHYQSMKVITTSCRLYRDNQVTVKEVRVLPFTNAASTSYLLNNLGKYSEGDFKPVVQACAGVPMALRCAVENIRGDIVSIEEFSDSDEILDLLEVASYSPSNQVRERFNTSFSLLDEGHQTVLKEAANDLDKFQDFNSRTKRSLYILGWLEHFNEHTGACTVNGLLCSFLKGISRSRDLQ